jgi:hypothetical protein
LEKLPNFCLFEAELFFRFPKPEKHVFMVYSSRGARKRFIFFIRGRPWSFTTN